MLRSVTVCLFVFSIFFLFCPCAFPADPEEDATLILTNANIDKFDKLMKTSRDMSCVYVQVKPELFDQEKAKVLMNWVSRGGTLWFYDSRLAPYFSMKSSPFEPGGIKCRVLQGEYGSDKKYPGIAIGCEALRGHSLTFGVRQVVVFALKVQGDEKDAKYSAVADEEGVTPLLRLRHADTFALAAIRSVGQGQVIFKPLLWEEQYDGKSFQKKLLNFSHRKMVPFLK